MVSGLNFASPPPRHHHHHRPTSKILPRCFKNETDFWPVKKYIKNFVPMISVLFPEGVEIFTNMSSQARGTPLKSPGNCFPSTQIVPQDSSLGLRFNAFQITAILKQPTPTGCNRYKNRRSSSTANTIRQVNADAAVVGRPGNQKYMSELDLTLACI